MATDLGGDSSYSVSAEQAVGPYIRAVRRHWRLVAAITLLAVLVAGATLWHVGSTYTADASILVTPLPEGDSAFVGIGTVVETGDPARTLQTAAALVDTPDAAAIAARRLGKPWTQASVTSAVSVAPEGASDVLEITAQASTAADAQRVATAYAEGAVADRARIVQAQISSTLAALEARLAQIPSAAAAGAEATTLADSVEQLRAAQGAGREPTLSVSQTAVLPTSPSGASRPLILLLALVGGFAIGSVAAVGLETFSRPVRDREEIQSLFPIPVLAGLPLVSNRRRSKHGTPPWALPAEVFEQLRMLRVQLSMSMKGPVIMVTSAGAGDGKTTVAAALAAAFAEADQSVILLDLDLRKPDLRQLLEVEAVDPMLAAEGPSGAPIQVPKLPGVRVFPTPGAGITSVELFVQRLPLLIAQARRNADFVVIDTAPIGEVSEAMQVAAICDEVVFVSRPRHTDRRRLTMARDLLSRIGITPIGMVLVGRETGLPRGDHGYAYSMGAMSGPNGLQKTKPKSANASAAARADVAADPDD